MAKHTSRCSVAVTFLLSVASQAAADDLKCYSRALGNIISGDWIVCANTAVQIGGAQACCLPGSQCGEDSLCHTAPSLDTGSSNWYPAGCTDATYQDPVCRLSCTTNYPTYAVYNSSTSLWNCCGSGGCNGTVTGETFQAIAPSRWSAVPTTATNTYNVAATVILPSSASSSSLSSAQPTTTSSPAPVETVTSTSTPAPSSSLSTGAQVGIGVGVGVVGLAAIAAALFFILRRRRAASKVKHPPGYADAVSEQHAAAKYSSMPQTSEMGRNTPVYRTELEAHSVPQELASDQWKGGWKP